METAKGRRRSLLNIQSQGVDFVFVCLFFLLVTCKRHNFLLILRDRLKGCYIYIFIGSFISFIQIYEYEQHLTSGLSRPGSGTGT